MSGFLVGENSANLEEKDGVHVYLQRIVRLDFWTPHAIASDE
jgi:hypothetical protein